MKIYSHKIINICLVPDENNNTVNEFNRYIINLSKNYNFDIPSIYELNDETNIIDDKYSLPHCTIMHLKILNDPNLMASFFKDISSLIDLELSLNINLIRTLESKIFFRDSLLVNKSTHPSYKMAYLKWLVVSKNKALSILQSDIRKICWKIGKQFVECLTPSNEDFMPHFTTWAIEKGKMLKAISDSIEKIDYVIPCKIAIGDCGPIGQVTRLFKYFPSP